MESAEVATRTLTTNYAAAAGGLRVVFAGGGSGGHVLAAAAIAEELAACAPQCRFLFLTSDRAIDQRLLALRPLPAACSVTQSPQPPKTLLRHPLRFTQSWRSCLESCRTAFDEFKPHIVVGVGGLASVPGALTALRRKLPVVLVEQNCVAGRANRLLSRRAAVTCTGWPAVAGRSAGLRGTQIATGVPVRRAFRIDPAHPIIPRVAHGAFPSTPQLLILGGSQGARRVNELVLEAFREPGVIPDNWRIIHQTGPRNAVQIADAWREIHPHVEVVPLIDDLQRVLCRSDLVISRAGAMTLAELCCCARPAILIPLSSALDDHQRANARHLERASAAVVIDETSGEAEKALRSSLSDLCTNTQLLQRMGLAAAAESRPDAATRIAKVILKVVGFDDAGAGTRPVCQPV